MITNPETASAAPSSGRTLTETVAEEAGPEDRLDAEIVKAIWKLSRLENATLRVIW